MPLNPAQVKGLKPEPGKKVTRIHDGSGLYLYITDKGSKRWRFKYLFKGKNQMLSVGTYPAVSLAEARAKTLEMVTLLKSGVNPSDNRKAQKASITEASANSFEVVAREWQAIQKHDETEKSKYRINYGLEKYVFPFIGKLAVSEIKSSQIVEIGRRMEASGLTETVHRVIGYCSNIFLYAISGERAESDPTAAAKKQLKPLPKEAKHMAAITSPAEVGKLLNAIDGYTGSFVVRSALMLAPLVFVRPGELRKARWSDIDFDRSEWRFTASKTRHPHIVPLSRQAVRILKDLHQATGRGEFVFPSPTSSSREMSDNAILAAFRRMGIAKEEHCGHGWRATARTLLDEELKYPLPVIEMQLAHGVKDVHGRAYNRTTFIKDRHEMMQAWADYLDGLRAEAAHPAPAKKRHEAVRKRNK